MEEITPRPQAEQNSGEFNRAEHEARQWALWCHLSALAGFIFPFGNIVGPLVIWQSKKDTVPGLDEHGKEVMNFQISMTIYLFVSFILMFVLIGFLLIFAVGILSVVLSIIGALEVDKGRFYRYPLTIRFIK